MPESTLAYLAEHARAIQDFEIAERHAAEAISIAAPRGLVAAQSAALAARARTRASQATANPDLLYQGRDAADAALRLATRHNLAWHELDALFAHATLDQAEAIDRGWAAKARVLHDRLVPKKPAPRPAGHRRTARRRTESRRRTSRRHLRMAPAVGFPSAAATRQCTTEIPQTKQGRAQDVAGMVP